MTIAIEFKAFDKFGKVTQKLNAQLKQVGKTSKKTATSMDKMKASAKKLNASFNRLAIVGFGALTLGMRKVIMVGSEFEQSIANLSALTGLGSEQMDYLSTSALEMGKAFGMSSSEVVDGMTKVGSNMPVLLKQEKALKAVTEASIKMARISGMTVPDAATALTSSMNAMGLASKDSAKNIRVANEMLDSMASLAKAGPSPINEQALAMRESAAVASKMGLSFQNLGGIIQLVAEKNVRGARAGRMLRNIMLTIDKESGGRIKNYKDLTEWIGNYGSKINNTSDLLKQFTKRDIVATLALLENKGALEEYAVASKKIGIANEQLNKVMATANMRWGAFKATVQSFAIKVFQKHLQEPLKRVIDMMSRFVEWLDKGSVGARLFMSALVGVGAGLTAIGLAFVAIKIGIFIKGVWVLTTAFFGLGSSVTLATGGLSLIIPILAGVATWFASAGDEADDAEGKVSKFSKVKNKMEGFNKRIKEHKSFWDSLVTSIDLATTSAKEYSRVGNEEKQAREYIEKETGAKEKGIVDWSAYFFGNAIDSISWIGTKIKRGDFAITDSGKNKAYDNKVKTTESSMLARERQASLSLAVPRLMKQAMENYEKYGSYGTKTMKDGEVQLVVNINQENGKIKSVTTEGAVNTAVKENLAVGSTSVVGGL